MTYKNFDEMAERLAAKLEIPAENITEALKEITREDVLRIAKNEKREG